MDPATFIAVLAAHLLCSGGLMFMIARRLPPRGGVREWATGLVLFGAAYVGRLLVGLGSASALGPLLDTMMVGATLLFIAGLRRFTGRDALTLRMAATALLVFLVTNLVVVAWQPGAGRAVLLNGVLGLLYAALAVSAAHAPRRVEAVLHLPLRLMAAMVGVLAALTLVRSAIFAVRGADNVYSGLFSQLYYAYASLAAVLLAMSMLWLVFERLAGQLATLATRDALTRVLNRSGLDDALARHFGRRQAPPVTLLSLDIDHFKRINDNHGHAAGDAVLRGVAEVLRRNVRPGDLVARMGGEEFCVCCPDCSAADAVALAERLRLAVATLATPAGGASSAAAIGCTISIGISPPCATLADWQRTAAAADAALYAAKAGGRNRVATA